MATEERITAEDITKPKRRRRKHKHSSAPVTEQNSDQNYEFNSWYTSVDVSTGLFGLNLYELYSPEEMARIIRHPMANNEVLRRISNMLYNSCGLLTQAIDYCAAMVNLYYVITPNGNSKNKRANARALFDSALKKIRHKELVRDALLKGMIDGVAFYYVEANGSLMDNKKMLTDYEVEPLLEINDLGMNLSAIPLPTDYTKIVGRQNSSYVLAFNLNYFDQLDSSQKERKLRMYPAEIRNGYVKWSKNRSGGNWLVLDNKRTIVHKIRSKMEEPWGRPLCLAAIRNIMYDDYFKETCRNVLDETNNQIIYQTLPPGQNNAVSSLTKTQQEIQHNAVKNAISTKNERNRTSFFTVAAGTKIDHINPASTDILDEKNSSYIQDQIGIDLGFMANLLSGSSSGSYSAQQNNLQLLMSEIVMWLETLTDELVKVINNIVIKNPKYPVGMYYLPTSTITRTEFCTNMKELYMQGKGSLQAWIAATGVDVSAYLALMDSELEEDFENKYPVHKTAYTLSAKEEAAQDDKGGRPENPDSTNDNTIQSRSTGANDLPSPGDAT